MRKLYYKLVRLIGYTFIFEDTINLPTWETKKRTHIALYRYVGMYDAKYGGMKLKRVWHIKIR
jgi:hypothetical protein